MSADIQVMSDKQLEFDLSRVSADSRRLRCRVCGRLYCRRCDDALYLLLLALHFGRRIER